MKLFVCYFINCFACYNCLLFSFSWEAFSMASWKPTHKWLMCVKRTVSFSLGNNGGHIQLLFCNFKVCNYIEIFTGVKSVTAPISLIQKNKWVNTNWFIYPWYIFSLSLYLHFSDPRSLSAPREAQLNLSAEISVRIWKVNRLQQHPARRNLSRLAFLWVFFFFIRAVIPLFPNSPNINSPGKMNLWQPSWEFFLPPHNGVFLKSF